MSLLEVKNLCVDYEMRRGTARAVNNVNFTLEKGETLGLIGESGCGKTTAAMSILGFVTSPGRIAEGEVIFKGKNLRNFTDEQMRQLRGMSMSIVRQEAQNALNPVLTVGEQIGEVLREHGIRNKIDVEDRVDSLLEMVGISPERKKSYPFEFSGGMRQRVMIALAAIAEPELMILDEPITGLDVIVQRQLLNLLNDLKNKMNLTALLIAHDLSVIAEMCSRVAVMYGGFIVEKADVVDLYEKPLHPYSKALIESYPRIHGEKKKLVSIPGSPPHLLSPPESCLFAERCKKATEKCFRCIPEETIIDSRMVRCHLYSEEECNV
ncbi:MAG: ABC transporter ATP-binding protein [Spirochaetales bacterium]|uniref:ABC transporter ATP-binding protein n=1 Tax=Candidatus Thalassospirochaeta sargassi TaxID=3119039 RepID=A0AAJ1IAG3_9SPIO|nr:ABC transporter ATP-binding protein [Spirochaetales bacterium]